MDRRILEMLLYQIRTAKDSIRIGIYRDYDEFYAADSEEDPFKKMFYELNDMCILISDKLKGGRKP